MWTTYGKWIERKSWNICPESQTGGKWKHNLQEEIFFFCKKHFLPNFDYTFYMQRSFSAIIWKLFDHVSEIIFVLSYLWFHWLFGHFDTYLSDEHIEISSDQIKYYTTRFGTRIQSILVFWCRQMLYRTVERKINLSYCNQGRRSRWRYHF